MTIAILLVLLVCGFEFINGFHDTANAVATVIYTKTLKPYTAIFYSSFMNFLGILVTTSLGYSVARKIYELMPRDALNNSQVAHIGIIAVVGILISCIIWNVAVRWFKIPSSSTHSLIASIAGAGIALAQIDGQVINPFTPALDGVLLSLLISPFIGALGGYVLYRLAKFFIHDKSIFHSPHHHHEQKGVSYLLIATCGFVSFAHGSNDGQKGVGMIMVVLTISGLLGYYSEFVIPLWAVVLIPTVLLCGTLVGWKRIMKTIGKKIGTHDMTYAQGASAELVAASTIGAASLIGLPVSTTHVLSSAVMGTMITKKADSVNWDMVKHIGLAWILTIPSCALLSFLLVELLTKLFS